LITSHHRLIEDFNGVKKIVIPILSQQHWTSILVDFETKKIILRDRLNIDSPAEKYLVFVKNYLIMAQRELKMSQEIDFDSFKLVKKMRSDYPADEQQNDCFNCGVILLADIYMDLHGLQGHINFKKTMFNDFRLQLLALMCGKHLKYDVQ